MVSTFWECAYVKSLGAFHPNARIEKLSKPSGICGVVILFATDRLLAAKVELKIDAVFRQKDLRDCAFKLFFIIQWQIKIHLGASLKRGETIKIYIL